MSEPMFRNWRKASASGGNGQQCVEVGFADGARAVRDTKDREGGYFVTTGPQWSVFMTAIKSGRYDG